MQQRKQASIIITVLILMVVSSFLVLVAMRYFMSMLWWYNSLVNYYKAYYLARGGMDMLMTQQSHRGWGYEFSGAVWGTDFWCIDYGCTLSWSITSHFPRVDASIDPIDATCTATNAIPLWIGQSAIFPLFYDKYAWGIDFLDVDDVDDYVAFNAWSQISAIDLYVYSWSNTSGNIYLYDYTLGDFGTIKDTDNWLLTTPLQPWTQTKLKWSLFWGIINQKWYFIILSNKNGGVPFSFCFSVPRKNMIWQNAIIRSDAKVQDAYVTLETVKTNRFPSEILLQ